MRTKITHRTISRLKTIGEKKKKATPQPHPKTSVEFQIKLQVWKAITSFKDSRKSVQESCDSKTFL